MRFFKLDTGQLRNFDAAIDGEVRTFSTKTGAVLRNLAQQRGWSRTLALLAKTLIAPDARAKDLVQGNVLRKRIRLPHVFGNWIIAGVYGWVKAVQATVLQEALSVELSECDPDLVVVYNGSLYPEAVLASVSKPHRRVFVEAGFFPKTLQIDPNGLNAANSVPRTAEFYMNSETDFTENGLPATVNNRKSKTEYDGQVNLKPGYVFVPFQVPSDMQVTVHSRWIRDMEMFLDAVLEAADRNPEDTFVIKEHPSFKRSVKGLREPHPRVVFANDNITSELIQNARAVLTLNSTVGIEALLFDRPVITLGDACYNIDGLVFHAESPESLDEALRSSKNWEHNATLRTQFLGYLWGTYLVHGSYTDLPKDLKDQIISRADA